MSVFLLVLLLACGVDYFAYPYGRKDGGRSSNRSNNGLWLRYTWYFGQHTDDEIRLLARQLRERQIRTAWFHVRHITSTGTLKFHSPLPAQRLISLLHRENPEIHALAWIYVGNRRGQGNVELSNSDVRKAMVREALWLTTVCGFDGVQWDYEVCDDGDPNLLRLLRETRAALPKGKRLSVATPLWLPAPLGKLGWSERYFAEVAACCDEIAVMCYDSGFLLPRSYVWLVRQQAERIPAAVRGHSCRVFLGLPTYGKGLLSHNPRAENIGLALRGVWQAWQTLSKEPDSFAGVALFADYTTEPDEWETYREQWLEDAGR